MPDDIFFMKRKSYSVPTEGRDAVQHTYSKPVYSVYSVLIVDPIHTDHKIHVEYDSQSQSLALFVLLCRCPISQYNGSCTHCSFVFRPTFPAASSKKTDCTLRHGCPDRYDDQRRTCRRRATAHPTLIVLNIAVRVDWVMVDGTHVMHDISAIRGWDIPGTRRPG